MGAAMLPEIGFMGAAMFLEGGDYWESSEGNTKIPVYSCLIEKLKGTKMTLNFNYYFNVKCERNEIMG